MFLAYIKGETGRADACEAIVREARHGHALIYTSTLSLAEVIRPGRKGKVVMTREKEQIIAAFFHNAFIKLLEFHTGLGVRARSLQWDHDLHVRDACHLATALAAEVQFIETYDTDFLALNGKLPSCPPIREPLPASPLIAFNGVVQLKPPGEVATLQSELAQAQATPTTEADAAEAPPATTAETAPPETAASELESTPESTHAPKAAPLDPAPKETGEVGRETRDDEKS